MATQSPAFAQSVPVTKSSRTNNSLPVSSLSHPVRGRPRCPYCCFFKKAPVSLAPSAPIAIPSAAAAAGAAAAASAVAFSGSPASPGSLSLSMTPPSSVTPPSGQMEGRCFSCKKKTGLLGFECRCGFSFCSAHRHHDAHNCTFDYKSLGREQLTKNNPLIMHKKIDQI